MQLKKSEILYFNVDYIEIYGTFWNYEKLFEGVDGDNSNYVQFGDFTVEKTDNIKNYLYKVTFIYNNFPVYAFYVGKKLNERITTRDYFCVYGSAFTQFSIDEIIDFIDTYMFADDVNVSKDSEDLTLKRFDLAVDIKRNIQDGVLNHFKHLKQKGADYFGADGKLQTHYIGEYSVRDNKSFLIRIYDKIADIKKKGKQTLYADYLNCNDVTRLEIEFRVDITKQLQYEKLKDKNYLFNLFIKYIEKHTKIFDLVKNNDVSKLKRLNKKASTEDLKYNKVVKDRYLNSFKGHARRIIEIGSCPVDILLREKIVTDLTLKDIGKSVKNELFDTKYYSEGETSRNTKQRLYSSNFNTKWK